MVFSNYAIKKVQVLIDDQDEYTLVKVNNHEHLYISTWKVDKYQDQNIHKAKIILYLNDGSKIEQEESKFILSYNENIGTTSALAKIVLKFNWSLVTQAIFGLCAAIIIIPFCYIRNNPKYFISSQWRIVKGIASVSIKNQLFFPINMAAVYISLGPWALGYIMDDNLGLLFPWGLFISGHILPADVTHLYAVFFMFPYLCIMILALALRRRRRKDENSIIYWFKTNIIFVIVMIFQVLHCMEFYLCYGFLATLIGICGIGRILFVCHLWCSSSL